MIDTRNVTDEFKGKDHDEIVKALDERGIELEIAIENTLRDFNMGTIVRSANAFGVRHVHVIGRKQWNKRGAMATDKYLHIHYHPAAAAFKAEMDKRKRQIYVIDNIEGSVPLSKTKLPQNIVMVFGQEGPGVSGDFIDVADKIIAIEQLGSTRSMNVGVAAGIVMYTWLQRYTLS